MRLIEFFTILTHTLEVPDELLLGLLKGGGGGAGLNRLGDGVKYSSPSPSSQDDCVGDGDGGESTLSSWSCNICLKSWIDSLRDHSWDRSDKSSCRKLYCKIRKSMNNNSDKRRFTNNNRRRTVAKTDYSSAARMIYFWLIFLTNRIHTCTFITIGFY